MQGAKAGGVSSAVGKEKAHGQESTDCGYPHMGSQSLFMNSSAGTLASWRIP